jgi:hypothetical protein
VEAIHNGRIGDVRSITVGVGDPPVPCESPVEPLMPGTDWTMWNGPSPARGYSSELCPPAMHTHYPLWRRYREYANGGLGDMGAHHFDIAQWALRRDRSGPVRIIPPEDGVRGLKFIYDDGVEMIHGGTVDGRFEGTEGWIEVGRGYLRASDPAIIEEPPGPGETPIHSSSSHIREWIDAIVGGTPTSANAETGHRTATICQLANIGYELRRPLRWDPVSERFRGAGADEADRLLSRTDNDAWMDPRRDRNPAKRRTS